MTRKEVRTKIAEYLRLHPTESYKSVALKLNCSVSTISNIAREYNVSRIRKPLADADLAKLGD